ncbi:multifunctional transcriptional regulator/nicotinamide-nucleotide adenylyltransferase/ribosylnicotinamide kinase NadR [Utexia brackfieldae]|uniref:multifunctional transcriptional regulator/nicotinamide-nucleotide adenylyltransferase/ribosylnicotinamide kinase NadR n=1 Tax=Utexia brackfieldae TaxID=3074108 RepID=UPI00370DB4C7
MKSKPTRQIGLIFGKFYPLHRGHLYMIEKASSEVDELHVMLGCESSRDAALFEQSQMPKQPQVKDRLAWLKNSFEGRPNIHFHVLDESGIASYPNGWKDWSDRVKSILSLQAIAPTLIFTSELQDVALHQEYFGCQVRLIDETRHFMNISATQIRQNPYLHWSYIAKAAQPFFVKRVYIISNSRSGNLAKQFANIYNTSFVSNGYINYIEREVCKKLSKLQEQNYIDIALLHAKRIEQASLHADRYIFTDLDFCALCDHFERAFGHPHRTLEELCEIYPFDIMINVNDFKDAETAADYFAQALTLLKAQL